MTTEFRSKPDAYGGPPLSEGSARRGDVARSNERTLPGRDSSEEKRKLSPADRIDPPARSSVVPVLVLAIGLLVSGAVAFTSWTLNNRNESQLLEQQTRQAGDVLTAALPSTATPLATAMQVVEATDGSVSRFTSYISSEVGPTRQFVSTTLWERTDRTLEQVATVGSSNFASPAAMRHAVTQAFHTPTFVVSELIHGNLARLGYGYALPGSNFAIYAERTIPADRKSAVAKNSAFSGLRYAIYLGNTESTDHLLTTSFSDLPPTGSTAKVTIPWGSTVLTMVTAQNGSLDGSLPPRLPWIFGSLGVVLSIAAALAAERLVRRRRSAEHDAFRIGHLYDELESVSAHQRTIAETLQRALLPRQTPDIPGIEAAVRYVPGAKGMEIGGDWYSIIATDNGRFAFVVGDVSGRGLSAATVMAALRFTIRAYALDGHSPATILEKCSDQLHVAADGHYATVLVGVGDVERREITIANAGHFDPLVIDGEGPHYMKTKVGVPIGVSNGHYEPVTITLQPGSTLIAFTDGLVERRGENLEVGLARLENAASGTDNNLDDLLSRVISELTDETTEDDIAMLGLRWSS